MTMLLQVRLDPLDLIGPNSKLCGDLQDAHNIRRAKVAALIKQQLAKIDVEVTPDLSTFTSHIENYHRLTPWILRRWPVLIHILQPCRPALACRTLPLGSRNQDKGS